MLYDSSWPVRGIADEFRYNLVLEGGHQWIVLANGAYVHHNIFIGGDLDGGGITGHYNINARHREQHVRRAARPSRARRTSRGTRERRR